MAGQQTRRSGRGSKAAQQPKTQDQPRQEAHTEQPKAAQEQKPAKAEQTKAAQEQKPVKAEQTKAAQEQKPAKAEQTKPAQESPDSKAVDPGTRDKVRELIRPYEKLNEGRILEMIQTGRKQLLCNSLRRQLGQEQGLALYHEIKKIAWK